MALTESSLLAFGDEVLAGIGQDLDTMSPINEGARTTLSWHRTRLGLGFRIRTTLRWVGELVGRPLPSYRSKRVCTNCGFARAFGVAHAG